MDNVCTVKNLSDYIAAIEKHQLFDSISRGEARKYDTILSSGIQRRRLRNYQKMLEMYRLDVESSIDGVQEKHLLAFAQHHGLPTNLLDFSTSPLVSLYFAVNGCAKNGYVYFLSKTKLININNVICRKKLGWGMLDDLLSFDIDLLGNIYDQMSDSFIQNRESMLEFFECHIAKFIRDFKNHRSQHYLNSIVGVSELEKAFEKYKQDRQEWINAGMNSSEITLQIRDSIPGFLNGFEQVYKGNILYPTNFIRQYTYFTDHVTRNSLYSANVDVMLFLLKMENLEFRNDCMIKCVNAYTPIYYELEFPYFFTYQPPLVDTRVMNQASIFIFQPYSTSINPTNGDIEQVWQKISPDFIVEIENPEEIRHELDCLGINSKHIYCDYDHIAQYIASKY